MLSAVTGGGDAVADAIAVAVPLGSMIVAVAGVGAVAVAVAVLIGSTIVVVVVAVAVPLVWAGVAVRNAEKMVHVDRVDRATSPIVLQSRLQRRLSLSQ